jgi:hypothetical protein
MVCFHRRYNLGDKHEWTAPGLVKYAESKKCISLPLYLYDHSGISISTTPFTGRAQHAEWDSGQVGYIIVSLSKVREEYGIKKVSKKVREQVLLNLEAEVKEYDQYLKGEVYGYVIKEHIVCDSCEHDDEKEIDSCWGFIGEPEDVLIEARGVVDSYGDVKNGCKLLAGVVKASNQ